MFRLIIFLLFPGFLFSQKISWSGYAEIYYSADFQSFSSKEKENFIFNHKRNGEIALNLALLKASVVESSYRGNIGLMIGNYAQYNLASEPIWAQLAYEANIGIKLSKKHNIWLDAGIFPSHIGFESALGADCLNLTRSILAENSPYYESGAKITYIDSSENLSASFLILNGWQRIQRIDSSNIPAIGFQLKYAFSNKFSANYSSFLGLSSTIDNNSFRMFHNFYAEFKPSNKWHFIYGLDLGFGQNRIGERGIWIAPVGIAKFKINPKSSIAARLELYHDPKNNIIENENREFSVLGQSVNYDFSLSENIIFRSEIKFYLYNNELFTNNNKSNSLGTIALIGRF